MVGKAFLLKAAVDLAFTDLGRLFHRRIVRGKRENLYAIQWAKI